jgi:vacuolar-type H+-ATPase catalytic subunit A/Vma1
MMVIYTPEECKEDSWTNITGQISERLDEVFGGVDSFDKYLEKNIEEVKECYKTIEKIVG